MASCISSEKRIEMSSVAVSASGANTGGESDSLLSDFDIYFDSFPPEENFTDFTLFDFLGNGGGKGGFNDKSASRSLNISTSKASNSVFANGSLIPDYLDDLLNDLDSDLKEGAACRG